MAAPEAGQHPPTAPTLATITGLVFVAVAIAVGIERLNDNSFLTHLATGRLIRSSGIPRVDPYTFTVFGDPWVVQSWLPSWLYASLESVWGLNGVRVLTAVLYAAIVAILWRLTEPAAGFVVRVLVAAVALAAMFGFLAERPFLIGLVAFGLCVLAGEGRLDPRLLVPAGWIWVNSHGSFPLGAVVLTVMLVGGLLDRRAVRVEAGALGWLLCGFVLGAFNPLGPRLLWFPIELLGRSSVLRSTILEWKPLALDTGSQIAFVLLAVLAVWSVVRQRSWRAASLAVVFVVAALASRRNVPIAVLALAPVVASGLPAVGTLTGLERPKASRVAVAALCVLTALYVTVALRQPPTAFLAYPVESIDALEDAGLSGPGTTARLVAPDYVGNYLSARYGSDAHSFVDDRYDLFPLDLIDDYGVLVRVDGDPGEVLDRYDADIVLWRTDEPLHEWLDASDEWVPAGAGGELWGLHCRIGSDAAAFCSGD